MKKQNRKNQIDRDVAINYVYEYGWSQAAELLNITEEKLEDIVNYNPNMGNWKKPHINKNARIKELNEHIIDFVNRNYPKLKDKYVKNITNSVFYQNDEDVLHNSLIKLCDVLENPSDDLLFREFDRIFKTNKWELQKNNNQMRIKEKAIKEESEDKDGENK